MPRPTDEQIHAAMARNAARAVSEGRPHVELPTRLRRCVHLGAKIDGEPCGSPLKRCELHQCVTSILKPCEGAQRCCQTCPDYAIAAPTPRTAAAAISAAAANRFEWVSTAKLVADAVALAALLPADCAGVVGVPRSGMLPGSVIATHLHLPLHELTPAGPRRLNHGSRGGSLHRGPGPLVVVDDTVYGGAAMLRARQVMRGAAAVFAAVYVRPERADVVDYYARPLRSPHLLEWNFANNGPFAGHAANPVYGRGIATDLDGILCHDEASGGPHGKPYLLPRAHAVRLIVTGRGERHRAGTEAWLREHGVRWERLEMLPDGVPLTVPTAAEHKARHYATSGCGFFIESEPEQAAIIHRLTGKPVICPRAGRVYQ